MTEDLIEAVAVGVHCQDDMLLHRNAQEQYNRTTNSSVTIENFYRLVNIDCACSNPDFRVSGKVVVNDMFQSGVILILMFAFFWFREISLRSLRRDTLRDLHWSSLYLTYAQDTL